MLKYRPVSSVTHHHGLRRVHNLIVEKEAQHHRNNTQKYQKTLHVPSLLLCIIHIITILYFGNHHDDHYKEDNNPYINILNHATNSRLQKDKG